MNLNKTYFFKTLIFLLFFSVGINLNASYIYQTTGDLNLRSGAGSKFNSIGIVSNGEKVIILDKSNQSWFKISYNGTEGYLSSKYLKFVETEKPKAIPQKVEPKKEEPSYLVYYIIGIIIVVVFMAVMLSSKKKGQIQTPPVQVKQKSQEELKEELKQHLLKNIKITVTSTNSSKKDNSIIDVTGATYNIPQQNLPKTTKLVPYWAHQYVYSFSEINNATDEQKTFYQSFKDSFLKGEFIDIGENNNYAFILLFDLIDNYEDGHNLLILENQLENLGKAYPKTQPYITPTIVERLQEVGDNINARRHLDKKEVHQAQNTYSGYSTEDNFWKLGDKYKTKLKLNNENVKLLNRLWCPSNVFCNIEYCCLETLKLFLDCIAELKKKYIEEGTTIDEQFIAVADIIAKKEYNYKIGSMNYKFFIETTTNEFYSNIFKRCENSLRDHYSYKRKLNTDTFYLSRKDVKESFEAKILAKVVWILPVLVSKMPPPDEATEIELNSQSTTRWKVKFEELTINYKDDSENFVKKIIEIGNLNKNNPSVENIFYEASKFISKYDKESALNLYIHYIYYDLKSDTFNNKELTKTIQKNLFKTNEQLEDFKSVVSQLIKDKNLENALVGVSNIFKIKRKKIQLNKESIKEVQQQHSGTVELLNEYLKDEEEYKSSEVINDDVVVEIIAKEELVHKSVYSNNISLNPLQVSVLDIFCKSNFSVLQSEIELFAKGNGVFKNQLIESLNEACYETLDDVLIEEEDDFYIINKDYYQKLLSI
ncbi:MAG: SH3 domain-containing protein [Bacteroidetes bacterium]|nr:SH3 domain-containing protein [Bacteroidota bacterium]